MAHFPPIPFKVEKLTNILAIDLYKNSRLYYKSGSQRIFHNWICRINSNSTVPVHLNSLNTKIRALLRDYNRIKASKNGPKIIHFENEEFQLPSVSKRALEMFKREENTTKALMYQLTCLKRKLHMASVRQARIRQTNKRKENQVIKLKKEIKDCKAPSTKKQLINKSMQTEKQPQTITKTTGTQCNIEYSQLKNLKKELEYWQSELLMHQEEEANTDEVQIKIKETGTRGNPYSPNIREAVYTCLQYNIARDKISPLIKDLVKIFTGQVIDKLPAPSTITNMEVEAGLASEMQLAEVLRDANNVTVMRDATTKKGKHFYGVKLSTGDQDFTLGTKEISAGTAEKYVEATVNMLNNINSEENPIFSKISNFMTDRSATEIKTNRLMSQLISHIEDDDTKTISSFHCSIHPLLQFAEEADKVAKALENKHEVKLEKFIFKKPGESYTQNMLRCVSKLFYDDKAGDPSLLPHFLDINGVQNIPIQKFKGNRFNTLFYNAAGTFSLHADLYKYLTSSKITPNLLHNSIIHYIRNRQVMSICQAIALVCCKITTPYFHHASTTPTALQMSQIYVQLSTGLKEISTNPKLVFNEDFQIFAGDSTKEKHNNFYNNIFRVSENTVYEIILEAVQLICEKLFIKTQKLFADFLPGGKFHDVSDELINKCKSCPSNNITLERLMAQVDRQLTIAPNTSTTSFSSRNMYKNNKTSQWLSNKAEAEKEKIIIKCRQMGECRRQRNIKDYLILYKEKTSIIKQKINEKEKKEVKIADGRKKLLEDVKNLGGLWTDVSTLDAFLCSSKTKKEQIAGLKAQITYRKEILEQNATDKKLFKKNLDIGTLSKNLSELINLDHNVQGDNMEIETALNNETQMECMEIESPVNSENQVNNECMEIDSSPLNYVGKHILHVWEEKNKQTEYDGKLLDYNTATKTFTVVYWNSKKGHKFHKRLQKYDITLQELQDDMKNGDVRIMQNN